MQRCIWCRCRVALDVDATLHLVLMQRYIDHRCKLLDYRTIIVIIFAYYQLR